MMKTFQSITAKAKNISNQQKRAAIPRKKFLRENGILLSNGWYIMPSPDNFRQVLNGLIFNPDQIGKVKMVYTGKLWVLFKKFALSNLGGGNFVRIAPLLK